MSPRKSLIRLHSWKVDEARRKLSKFYAAHAAIVRQGEELEASVLIEQAKAESMDGGNFLYQAFIQSVLMKREEMVQSLEVIDEEIQNALEVARAAFRDLKKFEIIEEHRLEEQRKENARVVQGGLDELATNAFIRRTARK